MNAIYRKNLGTLSKEELVFLVEQYYNSMSRISEICVEESKWHIASDKAVDNIRKEIYFPPCMYDSDLMREMIERRMGITIVGMESEK